MVAFEAVAIPRTVAYIFPQVNSIPLWTVADFEVHLVWALIGVVTAILLTWLNIRGIKQASFFQTSIVLFVIVTTLALVELSFVAGERGNMEPLFTGGCAGIIAVLVVVPLWAHRKNECILVRNPPVSSSALVM